MFHPYYLFIGHRYTRVKRKNHFISFISLVSVICIALGVMALITVLSVMNGFSKEIRKQMLSVTPHITLRGFSGQLSDWQQVLAVIQEDPKVQGAAPFTIGHGLLTHRSRSVPAIVTGIDPAQINDVYPLETNLQQGSLSALKPRNYQMVIGEELATRLSVGIGDVLALMVPEASVTPAGVLPRMKRFTIAGIYHSGTQYDSRYVFINLYDASKLYRLKTGISGIQIKVIDELQAPRIAEHLDQKLQFQYWLSDWTREFSDFFEAIKMEKTVMWCILLLISIVAGFNLVSSLVMMVADKKSNIAILRAMGASKRGVMGIFMVQGGTIGIVGTIFGLGLGLALASHVTQLVEFVQRLFSIQFISENVYFIGFVPSEIQASDVILVCCCSLLASFLATLYPAFRAASIQPAEALRYE